MKILKVYINKNIGQTTVSEIEVEDDITEDEANEIAEDEFFNECGFDWELLDGQFKSNVNGENNGKMQSWALYGHRSI